MHPILFRIPLPWGGHFDIATYGVMMALGTIAGVFVAMRLAKRDGMETETVIDAAFWAVLAGIAGAKIWYIVQFWGTYDSKWEMVKNFRSGLVFYGGLVGGAAAIVIYARVKRIRLPQLIDALAPTGMLGLAFGRMGCFFNGCCYGKLTESGAGVSFKRVLDGDTIIGSPAFLDQLNSGLVTAADAVTKPVIPTQLIESTGALVVFTALLLLRRKRKYYGEQTLLLFMLYPVLRFTVEFFRGDHSAFLIGLTIPQMFSLTSFVAAGAALIMIRRKKPAGLAVGK